MIRVIGCDSPVGRLQLAFEDQGLAWVHLPGTAPALPEQQPELALEQRALTELAAYFADPRAGFDLPFTEIGTEYQRRVWARLQRIPPGATLTYGDLARELGGSARAVGNACRANPRPILVPCHRVLAAGGLGGYAGATEGPRVAIKRWLLQHEGAL